MRKKKRSSGRGSGTGTTQPLLGRYEVIGDLGTSDHVISTQARDLKTGAMVVIKRPTERLLSHSSFAYQLERSALELLDVRHENLVSVLDARREQGVPHVVTEYVDGPSLADVLQAGGARQDPKDIQPWLQAAARALDFVHGMGSVHGEVGLGHLYRDADGTWKLSDLAFAVARERLDQSVQSTRVALRPGFTAPEVVAGGGPTPAADQYALAACVYHALVGERPGGDFEVSARTLREHISFDVAVYLLRGLSPNLEKRYPSCLDLAEACARVRPEPEEPKVEVEEAVAAADDRPASLHVTALPVAGDETEGRCWRLRMGRSDEFARVARDQGFVALGWGDLGPLEDLGQTFGIEELESLIDQYTVSYGQAGRVARVGAGQVWRFLVEMHPGDHVVVPNAGEGLVHVGVVDGEATFHEESDDACPLNRRRAVRWLADVAFHEVAPTLLARLEGTKPLVDLDADREDVVRLAEGGTSDSGGEGGANVLQCVVAALEGRSDDDFIGAVHALFAALRYDPDLIVGNAEQRWEVMGTLAGQGLAEVPVRITVYRTPTVLDSDAVYTARGTLAVEEHATIIALGGFTDQAFADATEAGEKPVRLIDGPALAALLLQSWKRLPRALRQTLGVERVERARIESWFRPQSP